MGDDRNFVKLGTAEVNLDFVENLTAQRQLKFGAGGGPQSHNSRVSFKDSFANNQSQNQYKWVSPLTGGSMPSGSSQEGAASVPAADLVQALPKEMETWEKSKMWPFSSVGYERYASCLPGFTDHSVEELRLEAYEALKAGNIQPYVERLSLLVSDANQKRNQLKQMTPALKMKLIEYIEEQRRLKSKGQESGVTFSSQTQPGMSVFSSAAAQPAPNSVFGASQSGQGSIFSGLQPSSGSVFGNTGSDMVQGSSTPSSNQPAFGASSNTLFGKSSSTAGGGPGLFGSATGTSTLAPSTNLFGASNTGQSTASMFSSPTPSSAPSLFGNTGTMATVAPSISLFGKEQTTTSSLFGSGSSGMSTVTATGQSSTQSQSTLYTPLDQLTPEEKEQFEAEKFTLGKIPIRPPPRELVS